MGKDQADRTLPHDGAALIDDRAGPRQRPQHRGQRLGDDHRGHVGQIGGQAGQTVRLRQDVLGEAVAVFGVGQHERAFLPLFHARLNDPADVLVAQPAGRARDIRGGPAPVVQIGAHVGAAQRHVAALHHDLALLRLGHGDVVSQHDLSRSHELDRSHKLPSPSMNRRRATPRRGARTG